jgi:hypothetical protein
VSQLGLRGWDDLQVGAGVALFGETVVETLGEP